MRKPNRQDYIQTIQRATARPTNKQLQQEAKAAREALERISWSDASDLRAQPVELPKCAICGEAIAEDPLPIYATRDAEEPSGFIHSAIDCSE